MSDTRPKLEVVPGGAASEPDARATEDARGSRWPFWVLLVLLAATLVGLVLESRRAEGLQASVRSLEAVVSELEAELYASEAAVSAHRTHLDDVRSFVAELTALVGRDPEAAR